MSNKAISSQRRSSFGSAKAFLTSLLVLTILTQYSVSAPLTNETLDENSSSFEKNSLPLIPNQSDSQEESKFGINDEMHSSSFMESVNSDSIEWGPNIIDIAAVELPGATTDKAPKAPSSKDADNQKSETNETNTPAPPMNTPKQSDQRPNEGSHDQKFEENPAPKPVQMPSSKESTVTPAFPMIMRGQLPNVEVLEESFSFTLPAASKGDSITPAAATNSPPNVPQQNSEITKDKIRHYVNFATTLVGEGIRQFRSRQ